VQKMSKSLGNAIGIHEPPLEMYGKIMSISDEMMWRYYELLTDVQVPDIEKMKREMHPMQAKKELARRIVADFHSQDAGAEAAEDWARQFQKDATPEEIEEVHVKLSEVWSITGSSHEPIDQELGCPVRLDKLLVRAGLAASGTEAARLIKGNSVRVNGEAKTSPTIHLQISLVSGKAVLTIRVGRRIKRVVVSS
jgi:tyrosyl-tRNA synthetase